ncbi:SDR family NAD(P)-dependent oxidoreductase [Macrococcus capreoli]|uniref:SDR family NAD(P)-dependent oxidoreductase n=1 Tax=Macrococcus capreoli TaxID=2982690 RepID=UPI003EE49086
MIGKKILITGATSGLGLTLTNICLARGAHVTAIGRNVAQLQPLLQLYPQLNVRKVDFNNTDDFNQVITWINEQVHFDYLLNCTGFADYSALINQSDQLIHDMIHVNLTQTVILTKHVVRNMHEGGMVVTIGSQSAFVTTPYGAIYSASKAGLNQVMNALRMESRQIHFLNVNTGPVNTQFITKANKGKPVNHLAEHVQLDVNDLGERIIDAMFKKKKELNLPQWMDIGLRLYGLAPRTFEKVFYRYFMTKK